jgi:methionyl-tRNA formyltransferase
LKIVVAATPSVALPTLDFLNTSSHTLISVITQPDKPAGRGKELRESPVSKWGIAHNIPTYKPNGVDEVAPLVADIDLLLTIGYGVILPESIFSAPRHGSLNLHFSLLPRWRGAAPVQRAIEAGDHVSGVTVFQLDRGMDTGPIYSMKRFALDLDITSDELMSELAELGVEAVEEALTKIEKGVRPESQRSEGASKAAKISKSECEIDWHLPSQLISQRIRAFTSNPGAWTKFRGEIVKIEGVHLTDLSIPPASIRIVDRQIYVGTGDFSLRIDHITASGKKKMTALEWSNGARLDESSHFG